MFPKRPRSPLSLSEDEKSPGRQRPQWDLPIAKLDQNIKHPLTLTGLNIPRTDFLKALNFERFSARSCLLNSDKAETKLVTVQARLCSEGESEEDISKNSNEYLDANGPAVWVNGDIEEADQATENDDEDEVSSRIDNEYLNDSDAENQPPGEMRKDPSELDQAELLARFKHLRDLQLEEQQRLIREQQRQLEKLREEQQRVQDMLISEQIAALSPQKTPMKISTAGEHIKIKLINSPKNENRSGSEASEFDYNHNKKVSVRHILNDFEEPNTMCPGEGDSTADDEDDEEELEEEQEEVDEDDDEEEVEEEGADEEEEDEDLDEDQEEVDEDYLQCSIVETEAEEHISHVEDLLRNSRDLFMINQPVRNEPKSFDQRGEVTLAKTPDNKLIDIEEQPVSGATKTFEELVEEQLQREKNNKETPSTSSSGCAKKRPFLKRGQGIARFGTSPAVRTLGSNQKRKSESVKVNSPKKTVASGSDVVLKLQKPSQKPASKSPVKQTILVRKDKSPIESTPRSSLKRSAVDDIDELEEFELLEKYADDYSFSSNCSIINPRPMKMKKQVIKIGQLQEESDDFDEDKSGTDSSDEEENVDTTLKNSRIFVKNSPPKSVTVVDETPSEPSSTPRRLKRKIASRNGETTTVEKDVLVEDFSPVHDENDRGSSDIKDDDESDFDDDETWATTLPKPNFSRPVQSVSKSDAAPTSKLVARLFPSLKAQSKPEPEKTKSAASVTNNDQGVMSKALKDKLAELEQEIEKFRSENAVLAKIKKERLDALEELKKEVEAFELKKNQEFKEIQEMKEEEMKKIRNERKLFEKYQKEMRAIPDKNQRREIEELKMELQETRDEMRQKEARWAASTNRQRNRIEALEKENGELQDELKLLEAQRLEQWKKEITAKNDEKKKKTQSVPPQQKLVVKEGVESSVTAQLREQFDKLLRASLDESPDNAESIPSTNPKEPKRTTPPKAAEPCTTKTQNPAPSVNSTSQPHPKQNNNIKRIDVKIDFGNGKYREITHHDGKVERDYVNGSKEVVFANGTRKQISADGGSVIVSFFNGDIKQILPDQRIIYYYADSKTQHTTYPDGIEILSFPNNQVEKHYPNGTREIIFPDQTIKYLYPGGAEESVFADGTVVKVDRNGDRVMNFPNGQREIHTKEFKKREYPDGTTKTVYPDGRQETRYSSGRVRVKDADGNVLVDKVC